MAYSHIKKLENARRYRKKWPEKVREQNRKSWQRRRDVHRNNPEFMKKLVTASRKSHLRIAYNMTPDEYSRLLDFQGGQCAICNTDKAGGRFGQFQVDHDHKTGDIRGLLCYQCNIGLGKFKDSRDLLLAAIEYLKEGEKIV